MLTVFKEVIKYLFGIYISLNLFLQQLYRNKFISDLNVRIDRLYTYNTYAKNYAKFTL